MSLTGDCNRKRMVHKKSRSVTTHKHTKSFWGASCTDHVLHVSASTPSSLLPVVPQQPEHKPGLPGTVEDGSAGRPLPHPHQRRSSQHTQSLRGPLWRHQRVCSCSAAVFSQSSVEREEEFEGMNKNLKSQIIDKLCEIKLPSVSDS